MFLNATGLIVLSCFQVSRFLENCYCDASVVGHGVDSYIIISFEGGAPTRSRDSTMRTSRIVATILAATTMAIYMIFLRLMSALPAEIDYL
jgi:riboflavin transporter FmnP